MDDENNNLDRKLEEELWENYLQLEKAEELEEELSSAQWEKLLESFAQSGPRVHVLSGTLDDFCAYEEQTVSTPYAFRLGELAFFKERRSLHFVDPSMSPQTWPLLAQLESDESDHLMAMDPVGRIWSDLEAQMILGEKRELLIPPLLYEDFLLRRSAHFSLLEGEELPSGSIWRRYDQRAPDARGRFFRQKHAPEANGSLSGLPGSIEEECIPAHSHDYLLPVSTHLNGDWWMNSKNVLLSSSLTLESTSGIEGLPSHDKAETRPSCVSVVVVWRVR